MRLINKAPRNHATMPDGSQIATQVLAEQLRQCRGRLTRNQMCAEIGLSAENPKHLRLVAKLCRKYNVAARDAFEDRLPPISPEQQARLLAKAKMAMTEQIRLARQEIRSGNRPAYKPCIPEWNSV